jgi:Ca2+/Na+ antiporter
MNYLNYYIILVVIIKILFILFSLLHLYYTFQLNKNNKKEIKEGTKSKELREKSDKTEYWRSRIEFIFTFLMASLLIYLFYPNTNRVINKETKFILYLFGIILLITAKWSDFITTSKWFSYLQNVLQ